MNCKSTFLLSCLSAAALAVTAAPASAQGHGHAGGGGARAGGGFHGGARPGFNAGARAAAPRQFAGRRWSGNGNWNGRNGGNWHGHDRNWWRHHGGYPRVYYTGFYPYWDYPWGWGYYGYPYYGGVTYYYDGSADGAPYVYNGRRAGGVNLVAEVQNRLARAGYYHGEIDGVIGNGTRRAIRAYERSHGLPVDGRLDDQLLNRMGLS